MQVSKPTRICPAQLTVGAGLTAEVGLQRRPTQRLMQALSSRLTLAGNIYLASDRPLLTMSDDQL